MQSQGQLIEELKHFDAVSLDDMQRVSLMKRVDTKFVISAALLPKLLSDIQPYYSVLDIDSNRLMTYDSTYYDTPSKTFYLMHHNGIRKRVKVRTRRYVDSDIRFLEIKQKDSKGNTVKSRIPIDNHVTELGPKELSYVESTTGKTWDLHASLNNSFKRFTLVDNDFMERVTIDLDVKVNNAPIMNGIAIIELKQPRMNRASQMFRHLSELGIHPYGMSKYCVGLALMHPDLKQNVFKRKIFKINKISA